MICVLIVDDHVVVRAGLRQIMAEATDISVVAEAGSGRDVPKILSKTAVDVVILDISLPGRSGLEILGDIRREYPQTSVLILSMHSEEQFAVRALKGGASGYLTKDSAGEELIKAVRTIAAGRTYISQKAAHQLLLAVSEDGDRPPHELLSDREFQVLCMIASGKTVSEIGEELSLSVKTISTYRTRILEKMHLENNSQLTRYVLENKLI